MFMKTDNGKVRGHHMVMKTDNGKVRGHHMLMKTDNGNVRIPTPIQQSFMHD
jgi:hypothetical protein